MLRTGTPRRLTPTVARTPPCNPPGVAPLAIDNFGSRGLEVWAEPENSGCSGGITGRTTTSRSCLRREVEATRGQFMWMWMEVVLGTR